MVTALAMSVLALAVVLAAYAYGGYALLLALLARRRPRRVLQTRPAGGRWPLISVAIPVYNEVGTIGATLSGLLQADYPADRRQILVVSDASTDGTDDIVRGFAPQGVELLRLPARGGKTAAENAALPLLRGEIIVNFDASIRVTSDALRLMVAAFADASVGVASGRDVSVGTDPGGEAGYVGYEMWLRDLETSVGGIVGASGCCYAIRADLHRTVLPADLSRDFAAALLAREQGFRSVSVPRAVCFVTRTPSLHDEFRRKVRTMTRGMRTLLYKRRLLNPLRYGLFAWMLFSHKVCRWLVPWAGLVALAALGALSVTQPWARGVAAAAVVVLGAAAVGWRRGRGRAAPRWLALPAYVVSGNVAALVAAVRTVRGRRHAIWEPTRRDADQRAPARAG